MYSNSLLFFTIVSQVLCQSGPGHSNELPMCISAVDWICICILWPVWAGLCSCHLFQDWAVVASVVWDMSSVCLPPCQNQSVAWSHPFTSCLTEHFCSTLHCVPLPLVFILPVHASCSFGQRLLLVYVLLI